tara:strand:+ start:5916 stop:6671 length:756 start_codon:yes stop_codon:yes gene_type:complete
MFEDKDKTEHVLLALLACLGVYLFVFMYLQISSFPDYRQTKSFDTYSELVQEDVELTANNIESEYFSGGEVSSVSRDVNDQRASSSVDWSENTYEGDPDDNAKEIERQLFESTGEQERRDQLQEEYKDRLEELAEEDESRQSIQEFTENQFSGNVMVEFELSGRTAFKKDNWYVRNPGYTCGKKSNGLVVVQIKVNRNGNVVFAQVNSSLSKGASDCMLHKAIEYAKKSRFNYSSSSAKVQSGLIKYRFVG